MAVARCMLRAVSTLMERAVAVLLEGAVAARGKGAFAALVCALGIAVAGWMIGALFLTLSMAWCITMLGPVAPVARPVGVIWLATARLVRAMRLWCAEQTVRRARLD